MLDNACALGLQKHHACMDCYMPKLVGKKDEEKESILIEKWKRQKRKCWLAKKNGKKYIYFKKRLNKLTSLFLIN